MIAKLSSIFTGYLDYTFEVISVIFALFLVATLFIGKIPAGTRLHRGVDFFLGICGMALLVWGAGFCLGFSVIAVGIGLAFLGTIVHLILQTPGFAIGVFAGALAAWLLRAVIKS